MTTLVQPLLSSDARSSAAATKQDVSRVDIVELGSAGSSPPTTSPITSAADSDDEAFPECLSLAAPDISSALSAIDLDASRLISSPYVNIENQLILEDLETANRLFAFALTALSPIRHDYATAPYLDSFNWPEVFELLRELCRQTGHEWKEARFYTVIFRSVLLPGIDRERLGLLDQKSHEEACASGGLLKYWFGSCDGELRNLATCLWRNREDARAGGGGPWHAQARAAARTMYKNISFFTHQLVVEDGATSWRLEEHVETHPHR